MPQSVDNTGDVIASATVPVDVDTARERAGHVIREWALDEFLELDEPEAGRFVVTLPGERKLRTTVSLLVGAHSVSVQAFVARHPDEHAEELYRWLLERNLRMYGVAYAVDHLGDIYLSGRMPLHAVTADELDTWMGTIHEHADGAFNSILSMGFATAIRKEWDWRISRGQSTDNLEAFRHLLGDAGA